MQEMQESQVQSLGQEDPLDHLIPCGSLLLHLIFPSLSVFSNKKRPLVTLLLLLLLSRFSRVRLCVTP